ncbi:O16 family O-antigen flippase [Vibrio cholerae]|uniref:oligosaccharide flippase family protein n=1 Tax=Vibrio cholerae TaxID=666 RepID=UPI00163C2AE9|nr:oligosaccharide flippase family protein [Vibrio cholerae]BER96105.1 O16 family O-antigen flippase [Vibrio cholerae]
MKESSLIKNIFYLIILKGGNLIIPLITYPYLVRVLGVEGYGFLGYGLAIHQYINQLSDYSLPLYASREISINRRNHFDVKTIFSNSIFVKIFNSLIISIIFLVCVSKESFLVVLILSLASIVQSLSSPWYFQGVEKIKNISIISLVPRLLFVISIFMLVDSKDDIIIVAFLYLMVSMLTSLISVYYLYQDRMFPTLRPTYIDVSSIYKNGLNMFIGLFFVMFYSVATPIIMKELTSNYEIGLFLIVEKIRVAVLGIFTIIGQAIYPRLSKEFSESFYKGRVIFIKVFLCKVLISSFCAFFIFLFSDQIIKVLFGQSYLVVSEYLKYISVTIVMVISSYSLSSYFLLPNRHEKIYRNIPILGSLLHVILLFLFVPELGAVGAIYSIIIVELLVFILNLTAVFYFWSAKHKGDKLGV